MDASDLFGSTFAAYAGYCLGGGLRYFAVAGGLYWMLHVAFRERWSLYRIQPTFPSFAAVAGEIGWSLSNLACTGLGTVLLYQLVHAGGTKMYFAVADHGWLYFGVSVVVGVVAFDAWFYWQHRLLHTPWLFRRVHAIHHRAVNPTAFAAFAHHPIETFMGNAYFIVLVALVPMHPLALGAVGLWLFTLNIITHVGYEFYPRGFTRHRLGQWADTSTHHNMHHSETACNYSICFNYWDRIMGTNHSAYHQTFDAITARARGGAVQAKARGYQTPDRCVDSPPPMADTAMLPIANRNGVLQ